MLKIYFALKSVQLWKTLGLHPRANQKDSFSNYTTCYFQLLLHSVLLAVSSVDTVPLNHQPRLSLVDWTNYYDHEPNGPGTYAFGYDVENPADDNVQYRDEERLANGTVIGSYGYLKPDNSIFIVRYVADENGYR